MVERLQWWAHQQAWLADPARLRICLKARQCGMSTVVAAEAIRDAVAGKTTILASASERQSRELMRRCLKLLPLVSAASAGQITIVKESSELVELSTGGRILSVPASAATVQGYSASVVLDEAAWMPNDEELWQALVPSITTSNDLRLSVLSTPRGKGGLFHRLWAQAGTGWSRHKVSVDDAIAGGCVLDREALRAAVADEATFRACYLCEFIDEQYSLLSFDLLEACSDPELPYALALPRLAECGDLYAGFDVGRKHDLSVLSVVEQTPSGLVCRGFVELAQTPFDQQEQLLEALLAYPNVNRLCIDASGIGLQLAERLHRKHGSQVEPVTLSAPVKEDLAARMLRVFQRGEIAIPDEPKLRSDLHSIEKQITSAGNVRFVAPRSDGSHADRFVALALALHALDKRPAEVTLRIVGADDRRMSVFDDERLWTRIGGAGR